MYIVITHVSPFNKLFKGSFFFIYILLEKFSELVTLIIY